MSANERIRYLRKTLLKITQGDFAEKINMSRSNFTNIEKGNVNLTERVLNDICREFSVSRDWLLNGEEPVFIFGKEKSSGKIAELYENLNENNQKYVQDYIHRLLDGQSGVRGYLTEFSITPNSCQNAVYAAFNDAPALSDDEISLLESILEQKKKKKHD